jgi:hypothetical protein
MINTTNLSVEACQLQAKPSPCRTRGDPPTLLLVPLLLPEIGLTLHEPAKLTSYVRDRLLNTQGCLCLVLVGMGIDMVAGHDETCRALQRIHHVRRRPPCA